MKIAWFLLRSLFLGLITMTFLVMWATHKSRERTACYRATSQAADCEQPGYIEQFVRWTAGPPGQR